MYKGDAVVEKYYHGLVEVLQLPAVIQEGQPDTQVLAKQELLLVGLFRVAEIDKHQLPDFVKGEVFEYPFFCSLAIFEKRLRNVELAVGFVVDGELF